MKARKILKIALLVIVAGIFLWTFVFLYQKSQPEVTLYDIVRPAVADLEKTTVVTDIEMFHKQTDFARLEKLYADKLISAEEYEKGEVTVKQAREELQAAKDNLQIVKEGITQNSASFSSTLIRSTIEGLILDVPVKVGNSVIMSNTFNDGTTIATVADMNDLIFRGNIDETEVGRVREGMPVKITIGALQDLTFQAQLEYIAPKSTEDNGANQFAKSCSNVPARPSPSPKDAWSSRTTAPSSMY